MTTLYGKTIEESRADKHFHRRLSSTNSRLLRSLAAERNRWAVRIAKENPSLAFRFDFDGSASAYDYDYDRNQSKFKGNTAKAKEALMRVGVSFK